MEEIRAKKRKRRIIGFSILGAVILLIVVLIIACTASTAEKIVSEGEYKQAEKRTIANSVSANGKIVSVNGEEVTSQQFGNKVNYVYVKEGDIVSPGQVICQFDTQTLQDQLSELNKNIAETKTNKAEEDSNYDRRVSEANANRLRDIADTEAKLNGTRLEYIQALGEIETANKNYSDYMADPNHHAYDMEAIQLESVIDSKKSNADYKKSNIESYEQTLRNLQETDDTGYIDARNSFDETTASSIQNMEESAKDLQKAISECTVRCTVGGTITGLNVKAGENFAGGTVATIEGLNDLMVEAEVSEYDIPDIAVGMKVMMKTEATRDQELEGYVTYVAPKASGSGSDSGLGALSGMIGMDVSSLSGGSSGSGNASATFLVKISLNEQNSRLRLGMNAKTSIITESVDNALAVPFDAVRDDGNGGKYVEIATNYDEASKSDGKEAYQKKKVTVTTGIKGSYYIQIFGDVKVGDYVYVPPAEGADSIDEIMNMMGSSAGV